MSDYATVTEPATVRFERMLPGPIELVWEFLTDSEKRGHWLAPGAMEPRVGSKFALTYENVNLSPEKVPPPEKYKDRGYVISHHTITRFEPPRFLSMTWGDENNPSEVSFELTAQGERTRLILVHRRLPNRASMLSVGPGWHTHLDILDEVLEQRTPGAFWRRFSLLEEQYEKIIPMDAASSR
jgi:uncharacterized protein YndB with AHSA1/START domain